MAGLRAYFDFEHLDFRYEPYPIGCVRPVMDPALYEELVATYPPLDLFLDYSYMGKRGQKLTLSEKEDPRGFERFIQSATAWREFYRYVKHPHFAYGVVDVLKSRSVDLGIKREEKGRRLVKRVKHAVRGRRLSHMPRLASRFEFSALPACGGNLPPHTDAPTKVVTLVLSMVRQGEWRSEIGGGTDVNRPKGVQHAYNQMNEVADFPDMEVLHTYDFQPNQLVFFVKTFNSWHSVRPMSGTSDDPHRRTLTINIEAF